jgi:hypothetical protein
MFKKPNQYLNPAQFSVNEEFRNKIVKPRTFFAAPFSIEFACVKIPLETFP